MRVQSSFGSRRSIGRYIAALIGAVTFVLNSGSVVAAGECWDPPVSGTIVDAFRQPECLWCAGNRGLEYHVDQGAAPRAVASGTVAFSGVVAGQRYVVIDLPNGWKLTYGGLAASPLVAGDSVVEGSIVGSAIGRLFFGLRIDGVYTDPAPYIGAAIGVRRLVPIDGRPGRASPRTRLVCRGGLDARSR